MASRWAMAAAVLSLAVLTGTGGGLAEPSHQPLDWRRLAPGLEFGLAESTKYVALGSTKVAVVRLEPERVSFGVSVFRDLPDPRPISADLWQKQTGATVVVNPGQFNKAGTHLGLLVREGVNLGTKLLSVWKGLFLAQPKIPELPRAAILDLAQAEFDPEASLYGLTVQSLMLLDQRGRKRVRLSDWKANRTVLAVDHSGRVLLLVTEGAYTLWEFADWLVESELRVAQAMALDGGYRSQLVVKTEEFSYAAFGQWETNDYGYLSLPGYRASLPNVIGVYRR